VVPNLTPVPSHRLLFLVTAALAAVGAAAVLLPHSPAGLRELLLAVGPAAPVIALGAWILLTPALFPGSVLAAAGGLAFGALGGAALAIGGALAGGLAAFALARTWARGPAERLIARSTKLASIDSLLRRRGFVTILASRLMPGVPATALHYAAGVSQVRPRAFAAAIAIGALLRTVPYALLGTGLASGSAVTLLVAGGSIGLGAVAAAALVRHVHRRAAAAA
jgi:uncharacterized membrane protein YdjX (TVP38/TMEM64 family)